MPARTTIFNNRAAVVHQLPPGPRNTILFSPHARFVLVAGFGNLQGQMDIYDRQAGMRKICTVESSNPSICEWSPDGRHILTATTSPRLRVDNGVMIWHYTGELMYKLDLEECYHVCWRPQPASLYPLSNPLPSAPAPHASAATHVATATPKKAAGAYRPPHARGSATPLHFKREDEGGAAHIYANGGGQPNGVNGFGRGRGRGFTVPGAAPLVPGAAPGGGVSLAGTGAGADEDQSLSKTALKNKKKREAAKKAKEQGAADGAPAANGDREGRDTLRVPPTGPRAHSHTTYRGRSKSRSREDGPNGYVGPGPAQRKQPGSAPTSKPATPRPVEEPAASTPPAAPATAVTAPTTPTPGSPTTTSTEPAPSVEDKKVRALLKKLRAIEDLKVRLGKGEKLEDTQLKKIKTEAGVRGDLQALGVNP